MTTSDVATHLFARDEGGQMVAYGVLLVLPTTRIHGQDTVALSVKGLSLLWNGEFNKCVNIQTVRNWFDLL